MIGLTFCLEYKLHGTGNEYDAYMVSQETLHNDNLGNAHLGGSL